MSDIEHDSTLDRRERTRRETDWVQRHELDSIIKRAVMQALDGYEHKCLLNLSPVQKEEVHNIFNAIKEIGNGQLDVGIERIRDNHKWLARYFSVTGRIGTAVITTIVMAILAFLGSSLIMGIIEKSKLVLKP